MITLTSKELNFVSKYILDPTQSAEHLPSITKVLGLLPAVIRHIFQLARCGYKLRVTRQTA